ncbi:MAG: AMIN domain-containing protein [candidate division Zixibacteria bacterium]|nr:AMIN domain-containing protein [candidate division Zixibacteria bacterium]
MRLNYFFKSSPVVLALFVFGVLCAAVTSAWGSSRIVNISLKKEGNFTKVTVYGDKAFQFAHSTAEAKEGKPYRVIIDCQDAIFDLPQRNFREGLPPGVITAIRTGQFQATPERIVRVVLDLKAAVIYKVADRESENEVSIALLTKQDPDFPLWVAVLEEKEKQQDQSISTEKKRVSTGPGETVSRKEQESGRSETLTSAAGSLPDSKAPGRQATKLGRKKDLYRRAVCYADTGEPAGSKPALVPRTEPESKDAKMREEITQVTDQVPSSKPAQSFTQKAASGEPDEVKKRDSRASKEPGSSTAAQANIRDKRREAITRLGAKEKASRRTYIRRRISRSPVPLGPFPEGSRQTGTTVTDAAAGGAKSATSKAQGLVEKGIGKILGPESVSATETQVLAESLMVVQGTKPSGLGLTPERRVIQYKPGTKRDPFVPITERGEMSFGIAPLPLFENLTLVGVLKDRKGNRALLEDDLGYGYILMSGDRIKNGYLIKVDDDKAFFHVEEYGGYQIMVLELKREY